MSPSKIKILAVVLLSCAVCTLLRAIYHMQFRETYKMGTKYTPESLHIPPYSNYKYADIKQIMQHIDSTSVIRPLHSQTLNGDDREFIINQEDVCSGETVFMLIISYGGITNRAERDVVRKTWGNQTHLRTYGNSKVIFLVGRPDGVTTPFTKDALIQAESKKYRDIIQGNFYDTYNNLPIKTKYLIHWAHLYCKNSRYIVKVDSDVFLNVRSLYEALKDPPGSHFIMGHIMSKQKPAVTKKSRYFISRFVYQGHYYPDYVSGTCYVLSRSIVGALDECVRRLPLFRMEDVYLTAFCRMALSATVDIKLVGNPGFHPGGVNGFGPCDFDGNIATHYHTAAMIHQFWRAISKTTWRCPRKRWWLFYLL